MEYDRKSVDLAIEEAAGRKVFLVHTIETVAASYEVIGPAEDDLETIKHKFEYADPSISIRDFDAECLSSFVDEIEVSKPGSEAA